jgi:HEAT repeats
MKTACLAAVAVFLAQSQQTPPIRNGKMESRSAASGLEPVMRQIVASAQSDPVWIGYKVPAVPGRRQTCWDGNYAGTVHLEGPSEYYILYRVKEGRIQWIQTFSPDCVIDAGNASFYWLTDVKPAESVAYLVGLMAQTQRGPDGPLGAIAVHATPEARTTLLEMARTAPSRHTRGEALVWLAQTAPPEVSKAAIQEALAKDPENDVKRRAVAALARIPHDEGIPMLLQLARTPANASLQKEAMRWLGRSKDERATKFFQEVLAR